MYLTISGWHVSTARGRITRNLEGCFRIADLPAKALTGAPQNRLGQSSDECVHTGCVTLSYSCRSTRIGSTLAAR